MDPTFRDRTDGTTTVLHLDDDRDIADLTATLLERELDGVEVLTELDPTEALDRLATDDVDAIVSDYEMPELNGLEFLEAVRADYPDMPFILFTGMGSEEIASEAISQGVTDYLQKGTGTEQYTVLANRIENAVSQRRAEREVEERSEWFSRILAHSSDYVLIVDQMGKVSYASPAIERVMGYEPESVIGNDAFEFVVPEDLEHAANSLADVIEHDGREVTVEFRSEAKDGSIRWLEVRGRNLLDDRLIDGIMVNVRDITDRKEREQRLERQQAFLDHSSDIITVLDEDGTIDYVSPSVERVLGYEPDELVGTIGFETVHPDHEEEVLAAFSSMLEEPGGEAAIEFRMETADGEWCWVDARGSNQLDDPVIQGVVINARDITARKEREREIEWQNERLEEFAEVVSHDLRNPLTVARAQLDLGRNEADNDHFEKVADAHQRIEELIDDLLTLAREGKDIGETEPVNLGQLVADCWQNVATGNGEVDVTVDGEIEADPTRLQQLLENLMRNATEHADRPVTISVGPTPDGFYLEDDGPGIPEEDRDTVFDAGYSTAEKGTGFGLTIVKQVTQAHGWSVDVTEGSMGGARFEFSGVEAA